MKLGPARLLGGFQESGPPGSRIQSRGRNIANVIDEACVSLDASRIKHVKRVVLVSAASWQAENLSPISHRLMQKSPGSFTVSDVAVGWMDSLQD